MNRATHGSWSVRIPRRDPAVVGRLQRDFLAEIDARRVGATPAKPDRGGLSVHARRVLHKASQERGTELMRIYRDLGLRPADGKAAVDELQAQGLARVHRLPRQGRGGQFAVLEVLPAADVELKPAGLERLPQRLKGGFRHDLYGHFVADWARDSGQHVEFEQTLGSKTFDLVLRTADGRTTGVEICLGGNGRRTAEQLERALAVPGLDQVMAVFESKKLQTATECERTARSGAEGARERLDSRLVAKFVEDAMRRS